MKFDNIYITVTGEEIAPRTDIPKQYQDFLPESISKDRYSCPYTYDPFLLYFNENAKKEAESSIYSDRLSQWDSEKTKRLSKKHLPGKRWDNAEPKQIQAFLCAYLDKKVVLVANIQYVNMSSGYPVWRFDFYEE
ncbi:hypothetical protein LCGC14_1383850 [marine sediment metagenome]|uniref:Uncharacterized protein n=1 Tax=marine sediment metagenome TaxID=412755 RepID=A0A0F9MH96_9ZZZZ